MIRSKILSAYSWFSWIYLKPVGFPEMLRAATRCENLVPIFTFSNSWPHIGSLRNHFGLEYFGFEIKAHCGTLIKNGMCMAQLK